MPAQLVKDPRLETGAHIMLHGRPYYVIGRRSAGLQSLNEIVLRDRLTDEERPWNIPNIMEHATLCEQRKRPESPELDLDEVIRAPTLPEVALLVAAEARAERLGT